MSMGELFTLAQGTAAQGLPAWRPFVDPINMHGSYMLLLIPLAIGIAVTFKAVRVKEMKGYARQVVMLSVQTVLGMAALALVFYLLIEVFVRWRMG